MFNTIKKISINHKLSQALKTRRLRRGMDYFRHLLAGEMRNQNTPKTLKRERLLMFNNDSDLVNVLMYTSVEFKRDFNKVSTLYPFILSELISIIDESEVSASMQGRTQMFTPGEYMNTNDDWINYLNHQRMRLGALYDSYPREVTNIFRVFGNLPEMHDASRDVRMYGSFDKLIHLIALPGDRQQGFKEEISYFMSFCELIK